MKKTELYICPSGTCELNYLVDPAVLIVTESAADHRLPVP